VTISHKRRECRFHHTRLIKSLVDDILQYCLCGLLRYGRIHRKEVQAYPQTFNTAKLLLAGRKVGTGFVSGLHQLAHTDKTRHKDYDHIPMDGGFPRSYKCQSERMRRRIEPTMREQGIRIQVTWESKNDTGGRESAYSQSL
jgi:hypothetical protein